MQTISLPTYNNSNKNMNFNIAEYVVSTLNILINCPIAAGINVFNPHSIIPNKKYIPYSILY